MNVKEKIQVGPTAPYKYLHLKLKRTADNGGLSLTFLARTDISQAQMQPTLIAYAATMIDGTWYDYVFDLSTVDVADKTAFGFYIRPNITAGLTTAASISYIDDIYLSNSATASSANITIPIAISAGTGGTVSQATNSYLSGDNATVVATPSTGYIFNNWTEGGNPVSSNASYTFSVSTARTLVANFLPSKTFTVTVPAGTAHVYIVGSFTLKSWDATATAYELTRVGITNQFTGTFACDNSISYKYLCENMNDYDYQAAVSAGGVSESNRSYSASDNVVAWYRMKTITLNVSFATASIPSKLFVKGGWDSWATPIELTKSGSTFNTTISGFGSKFPANTEYKYYTNDGATSNYECNSDGSGSSNRWSIYPTMTDQVARFLTAPTIQTSTNSNISDLGLTVTQLGGTDLVVASGELILDQTPVSVNSITVNPGAKLTLASGKTLTAGTLTLQSDATNGSATFVDNGGTLSATATVQQYLTGARNWYFTSPITSATSNVVTGTVGNQLWSYSEPGYNWNPITATDSTLHVGNGYVAKLAIDGTLSFTGTLNTGNQQVSLIRTENGKAKRGFNLIGNPYPSYLDPTTVINSAPEMENTVWYRIKVSSTYHFETVNTTSGIGTNNSGAGAVTKYIPPMQAFWVRVAPTYTAKSLTFTNTMRSHEAGTNRLRVKEQNTQQIVRLQVSNGISSDETVLYSDPNASGSYDPYDSQKMTNSIASIPEIYTLAGTEQLAINGLDVIPYDTEFPIGFTTGQAGTNFSIKASQFSNFETGIQILLHDYLLNTTQDLAMADYSFTSDAVATSTRFTVLFKAPSVATGINQNANANVWISLANNQILVNGVSGESTVAVYNAVGQRLVSQRLIASTKSVGTFVPGVYLVTVTNSSKSVTQKVIIK